LKFLVIAALFAFLLLLVYSRVYPYLNLIKKILGAMGSAAPGPKERRAAAALDDRKLVRCISCGTWVPAERALGRGVGGSVYCSRECREKGANSNEPKLAD
jgi:hypothetical protein